MATSNVNTYAPKIFQGGVYFDLPTPLMTREESFSVRLRSHDIPLRSGTLVTKRTRGPLMVSASGLINVDSREELLAAKQQLYDLLVGNELPFSFFVHYDTLNGYYRWYEECEVSGSLQFHNAPNTIHVLPYSFTVLVPNGREMVQGTYPQTLGSGSGTPGTDPIPTPRETIIYGSLVIQLDTDDDTSAFVIRDSSDNLVFKVTGAGNVLYTGFAEGADTISDS